MPETLTTVQSGTWQSMPKYKCHKEVWALKIVKIEDPHEVDPNPGTRLLHVSEPGYAPVLVSPKYIEKHNPQPGGYFVVYQDGYQSFSPAEAFESGYTRIGG